MKTSEVALVTGATSGIGRAVAVALGSRGASVGIVGYYREPMEHFEETARLVRIAGGTPMILPSDVSNSRKIKDTIQKFVVEFGGLDTVVSSAGLMYNGTVLDITEADHERMVAVNLHGTFYLARYAVPELINRGGGAFVTIASDSGIQGSCGFASYTASKFAVVGLTKCLALDYGMKGVRANVVAPGFTLTSIAQQALENMTSSEREFWQSSVPLGRFALPEDIANVVAFISSEAGSYLNGVVLPVDGGSTAGYYRPSK